MKKIAFFSLGCKLNFSEISYISNSLPDDLFTKVDFKDQADIYIINTCTVTNTAEKKCRNAIKQAHRRNPDALIAVVGCMSQLEAEKTAQIEGVKIVLGSADKFDLIDLLTNQKESKIVNSIDNESKFISSYSTNDRTRSFLKIQDGCNCFCSYCAVPYARGRSRSDSVENVIVNLNKIIDSGVKEIVLTGVNIGDFGKYTGQSLLELLKEIEKIEKQERLRLSSIEPESLTDEIIELVAKSAKIMPHFHIPLQSGSEKVLKLMNRHYLPQLFADKVLRIKQLMPHACIAADVIVGFPAETDRDFDDTYNFLNNLPISYLHVFRYSERKNTKALLINPKVDSKTKDYRSKQLHQLSESKKMKFYNENIGTRQKVLFESDNIKGNMTGFTQNYIKVKIPFNPQYINTIVEVEITNDNISIK